MAPKITEDRKRSRGRPSAFDRTAALSKAMTLFWERGYEGTSFDELKDAMGISASTFYNAFKSKEDLYREAVSAYLDGSRDWFVAPLAKDGDVKTAFRQLFDNIVVQFTGDQRPAGCMISLAGTHLAPQLRPIQNMMTKVRAASEAALAARLRKGQEDGQISETIDINAHAAFYEALSRGLAVQARDGASREKLTSIVDVAMTTFPRSIIVDI